ncbi:MAG: dihydroorotase [Candidatus Cloacimonetes bacterium]|nr:dihydroorotase [Candidatus Cloacimonadota bacterium]
MKTLIKNGKTFFDDNFVRKDILIEDERIIRIAGQITDPADQVIDATSKIVTPGFVDIHTHLRDPGQTYKEDIITGTLSAAKGGFTSICAMPNTEPVVDNIATVEYIQRRAKDLGYCKVYVIGALSKDLEGKEIAEMATMQQGGIVAVTDDGKCIQNAKLMLNCMRYAVNFNLPVISHAEDYNLAGKGQIHSGKVATQLGLSGIPALAEEVIIARDIMLAESAKAHLHIAHISTAKSLELVRRAKENGLKVTCEVTPHHLLLTEEACLTFDTNTKMKPPLRSEADRLACVQALADGLIDCIATDHAPHADYEKEREFDLAPFGIIGFESAFAVLYQDLVKPGHLTLERLIETLTSAPAKLLNLKAGILAENSPADLCIIDLGDTVLIDSDSILSKSKNTPWLGQTLAGKVTHTICGGKITWQAEPAAETNEPT